MNSSVYENFFHLEFYFHFYLNLAKPPLYDCNTAICSNKKKKQIFFICIFLLYKTFKIKLPTQKF